MQWAEPNGTTRSLALVDANKAYILADRCAWLDKAVDCNWPRAAYTRFSAAKLLRKLAKTLMAVQDPDLTPGRFRLERQGRVDRRLAVPRSPTSPFAYILVGCQPSQGFEPLCEVVGRQESGEMASQLIVAVVMVAPDSGLFQRAVHALDLAVGPRMLWL
jgi:hypothetical protein